jgi:archaemetzincin
MRYYYIKSMGTIDKHLLQELCEGLQTFFPYPLRILQTTAYPLYAFEPRRNQYYAKKIIEQLLCEIPGDCEKMLCVTDVDLCTPVLTFVFGEAQLDGKIAIVSLNRLRQEFYALPSDGMMLRDRLLKECIHELGHCYGLYHCHNSQCVMFLSNNLISVDNKQRDFCDQCGEFFSTKIRKEKHEQE